MEQDSFPSQQVRGRQGGQASNPGFSLEMFGDLISKPGPALHPVTGELSSSDPAVHPAPSFRTTMRSELEATDDRRYLLFAGKLWTFMNPTLRRSHSFQKAFFNY